jgi:hypothetical protein
MEKYVLTGLLCSILFIQERIFGFNDYLAVVFLCIYVSFFFVTLAKLHAGGRRMLRVNALQDSWLYRVLSRESTFSMKIYVAISSLILGSIFTVLVKGMVLQKGHFVFFSIVIFSCILLHPFINRKISSELVDRNLNEDIAQHGSELVRILYASIFLTIVLSIVFSLFETIEFINSSVDLSNFGQKTLDVSYAKTEDNEYSRIFINAYLLVDNLKIALAKAILGGFELQENFAGLYMAILLLNILKLFAFSVSFVILLKGLESTSNFLTPFALSIYSRDTLKNS